MSRFTAETVGDLLSGFAVFALGATSFLWVIDAQIYVVPQMGADAHLYPSILAVILILLGVSIMAGALLRGRAPAGADRTTLAGLGRVLWVVFCAGAFAVLTQTIGFAPAAMLSVAGFSIGSGLRNPIVIAVLSAGVTLAIYVILANLLNLPMPA